MKADNIISKLLLLPTQTAMYAIITTVHCQHRLTLRMRTLCTPTTLRSVCHSGLCGAVAATSLQSVQQQY
jgi:hypothetical protein